MTRAAHRPPHIDSANSCARQRRSAASACLQAGGAQASKWRDDGDELNLAGVLNALDGVVDCPGRMLVVTSNHPEALDPALLRPGRINKRLFLGPMAPAAATAMAVHHFPDASAAELRAFRAALASAAATRLVPAHLEALCVEHDTLAGLAARLQASLDELEAGFAQFALPGTPRSAPSGAAEGRRRRAPPPSEPSAVEHAQPSAPSSQTSASGFADLGECVCADLGERLREY